MAVSNVTSSSGTSVSGLSSGIDSASIIDALIKADRSSTSVLEKRRDTFQARLDGVRLLNTRLLSHQLDLASLNAPSLYSARSATSSNNSALTATASSAATAGTYQFEVITLAKAGQVATASQGSASSTIGAGTIALQLGGGAVTNLTIDSANSSLNGIAQAINAAGFGASASVLNDGSGFRLMLTSSATGTANAVSVTGGGGLSGLFSGMSTLQAAADAQLRIGSGGGAVTITQASNTFSGVVQGVELKVSGAGVSTVTVGVDGGNALAAAKRFVSSYNDIVQFMKDNASYDSATNRAGPLFAEGTIRNGVSTITQALLSSSAGGTQSLGTLTAIGVTLDRATGKLVLDETAFQDKMAANPAGVAKVFSNSGTSSDAGVQFGSLTQKTATGSPFVVVTTQAATQPLAPGSADVDGTTVISAANRDLSVKINGRSYQVVLADGSYTGTQLSAHLQTVLDQKITTLADRVKVGFDGARLSLSGLGYGLSSTIQVEGTSTANSSLRLSTAIAYGQDVAGTINGVVATGVGQTLTGAAGTTAEGLRLLVTAGAPVAGATVTVAKGLAQLASERVKQMTDGSSGTMANLQTSLDGNVKTLNKSIDAADARLIIRKKRYQSQFLAMEKSIQSSNSLGNYLTGQIKGFENAAKGSG